MSRIAEAAYGDRPLAYPDVPGATNETTSREAAESVKGGCEAARATIFRIIARSPATADEVAAELDRSILYVRPRIAEMHKLGQIVDSGIRRKNSSKRPAIVWRIKL